MSALRHATISAWQRHEDGSYAADLNGWTLRVRWHPERPHQHRGFRWEAEKLGSRLDGDEIFEEIEVAMAHAEEATEPAPVDPPAPEAASHEGDSHNSH